MPNTLSIVRRLPLEKFLLKWIVSSNPPLQEVDNSAFREFIDLLKPSSKIPSRNSLKKMIEIKYELKKEFLKNN